MDMDCGYCGRAQANNLDASIRTEIKRMMAAIALKKTDVGDPTQVRGERLT